MNNDGIEKRWKWSYLNSKKSKWESTPFLNLMFK